MTSLAIARVEHKVVACLRRHWLPFGVTGIGSAWIVVSWAWQAVARPGRPPSLLGYASDAAGLAVLVTVIAIAEAHNRRMRAQLAERDRQLTQLLERSPDAIVVIREDVVVFANAAARRLMRAPDPAWFAGRPVLDLIHPDDRGRQAENLTSVGIGTEGRVTDCRLVTADGSIVETDVAAASVRWAGGPAIQVVARDASERRAAERVRDASERRLRDLLDSVGLLAMTVDGDGRVVFANRVTHDLVGAVPGSLIGASAFDLLWFPDPDVARRGLREAFEDGTIHPQAEFDIVLPDGRRRRIRWHLALLRDDDARTTGVAAIGEDVTDARATSDRLGALIEAAPVGICAVDIAGRVRFAKGGPFGRAPEEAQAPRATLEDLPAALAGLVTRGLAGSSAEAVLDLDGHLYEASIRPVDGPEAGVIAILVEITDRALLERDRDRLATAIDQATDAIVITDRDARISYVNPAFERVTGYAQDEVLGKTPAVLRSGAQSQSFYTALWRTLLTGRPWSGELVNRAKDGTLFREEATITPVRDASGTITNFVAVKRDVTRLRSLENALEAEVRERAAIVTALETIDRSGSVHDVAVAIAREVSRVPGVDSVTILLLDGEDLVPIAITGPQGMPLERDRAIPAVRSAYLRMRAAQGPWAEPWQTRADDGPFGERMLQAGIAGAAYIPLRVDGRLLGLLVMAATRRAEVDRLIERLPSLVSLGTVATSLLAGGIRARDMAAGERRSIEEIIAGRLFSPVYQPVIDVTTGEAVGFEALTRFTSGERPDVVFRRAANAGLGPDLEALTLQVAIAGAAALPASAFLSINVTPSLVAGSDRLAAVLETVTRPIVLEVTEHAEIEDYQALRDAARRLPVPIRLAVDDAGAGFASLRHVLELAPDIVKIDRSIVARIDGDPARQALVAGLRFFASRRGIQLIAEGVETPAELAALTALAVPMAQGYLLGAPAAAAEAAAAATLFGGLGVPAAVATPAGRHHANGTNGTNGSNGANGSNGTNGANGRNGHGREHAIPRPEHA